MLIRILEFELVVIHQQAEKSEDDKEASEVISIMNELLKSVDCVAGYDMRLYVDRPS